MSEIRQGLFIGDMHTPSDAAFLLNNRISLIINATPDLPRNRFGISEYRVPVQDDLQPDSIRLMTQYLPTAVYFVTKYLSEGKRVLVHCVAGKQRSAIIVASFLAQTEGLSPRDAIEEVRRYRDVAFSPYPNFYNSLVVFSA